ncbi:unnamed protein product [Peronospora belbahrii]|nr:unnamed protein product [Peronospora belbahrii]
MAIVNNGNVSSSSDNETVAQLLSNVQVAVADDPALAHMFNISDASQMSEEELTTLLQGILTASLSGSLNSMNPEKWTEDASGAECY